jgi:transcriptional regulator with XRE-family HTH domain
MGKAKAGNTVAAAVGNTSYSAIARAVGISTPHVSYIMRGMRSPSLGVASRIAGVLGVSMDEFTTYVGGLKRQAA